MKVLRFLFLALLIVLTVCVYRLAEDGTDDQIESPTVDYLTNRIFSLNTPITSVSLPEEVGENFNALTEGHIDHVLNEINPANDWLLNVNDVRRKSILEDPSSFGISNVDELPELGMIRFSISNSVQAFPLLNEYLEVGRLSINHPLYQPPRPPRGELMEGEIFNDSFINWMGGSATRDRLGAGIKVALLDSGVDANHPLLSGVAIRQKDFLPPLPTTNKRSFNSHGTAMASVIASHTDSYSGVAPGCEILSYRVIDDSGYTDSYTVASAIISAVKDGADVINLSLGGETGSEVLKASVSYANNHGIPVIAAVGNEGVGYVNFPAAYEGVIGVASVGANGRIANFSNFGKGVDLAAPGTGVLTASDSADVGIFTGTSISTAIVTGAVAMELSRRPTITINEIEQLLKKFSNEAGKPGYDSSSGHGVLSLGRLENKENAYYTDPAVVGYYFEYLDGVNAGTLPFDVMVENQGNTWLSNLSLHVNYLGKNKVFRIDNLPPGELRVEKLYLQGAEINESVEIDAQLHLPAGLKDNRIENNQRMSVIKFPQEG
jgi:subtilisin family serine protease